MSEAGNAVRTQSLEQYVLWGGPQGCLLGLSREGGQPDQPSRSRSDPTPFWWETQVYS